MFLFSSLDEKTLRLTPESCYISNQKAAPSGYISKRSDGTVR